MRGDRVVAEVQWGELRAGSEEGAVTAGQVDAGDDRVQRGGFGQRHCRVEPREAAPVVHPDDAVGVVEKVDGGDVLGDFLRAETRACGGVFDDSQAVALVVPDPPEAVAHGAAAGGREHGVAPVQIFVLGEAAAGVVVAQGHRVAGDASDSIEEVECGPAVGDAVPAVEDLGLQGGAAWVDAGEPGGTELQPDDARVVLNEAIGVAQAGGGDALQGDGVGAEADPADFVAGGVYPSPVGFRSGRNAG